MAYYYSPFRKKYGPKKADTSCPFCDVKKMKKEGARYKSGELVENEYYRLVVNMFPKFEGHTLVIPKKHLTKLGTETAEEVKAREELFETATIALEKLYKVNGVEIFIQYGLASEMSVPHLHWHVVPASPSDPIRGFDKLGQFFTMKPNESKVLIFPIPIKLAKGNLIKALSKTLTRKGKTNESSNLRWRKGKQTPGKRSAK